jgi:hypothetical protein
MVNGKTPLYLTVLAALLAGAAVLLIQPYSADFPDNEYARPARRYLRAALQQDSSELQHLSGSRAAVEWGLQAGRIHGDTLSAWATRTTTYVIERRGDTAEVVVYSDRDPCGGAPIVLKLLGRGARARVIEAGSKCLATR